LLGYHAMREEVTRSLNAAQHGDPTAAEITQ